MNKIIENNLSDKQKILIKILFVTLLSIIITLLCSRFFKIDDIRIEAIVESPATINFKLQYSRDNLGFDEKRSIIVSNRFVNKSELIEFSIPEASIDGLKFIFGNESENGSITFHSLKINGNVISLPSLFSKDTLQGIEQIKWKNNSVVLTSLRSNPSIVFPKEISSYNSKRHYKLLPLMTLFIISLILTAMLVFKYFPHFYVESEEKKQVTINLAFVTIVALLLIFPITHFDKRDASIDENRMLASFPVFNVQDGLDHNFSKEFEAWLNDRFAGRSTYIRLHDSYNSLFFVGNFENDKAFLGLDDWIFYKKENSVELFQGKLDFSENQLHLISSNLQQYKQWFASQGITYSLFIAPNKEDVYFDFYNPYIHKTKSLDRIQQLKIYLENNGNNVSLVYPLNKYLDEKNKGKLLYCKNDTHWSEYGAYLGYLAWMDELKTLKKGIDTLQPDQFVFFNKTSSLPGDLEKMLKLDKEKRYSEIQYSVPTLIGGYKYKTVDSAENSHKHLIERTVCPDKNYKVIVFRDSFTGALVPYISSTFHEVIYVWSHDLNLYRDFIRKEKPDIVLHEMVSRYSHLLMTKPNELKGEL